MEVRQKMKSTAIRAAAVLGLVVLVGVQTSHLSARVQDPTAGELRRLTEAYAQAWAKGDARAVAGLYSTEAIRVGPEGKVSVGRAAIEQAVSAALAGPYRTTKIGLTSGQTTRAAQDAYVSEGNFLIIGGMPPAGVPLRGRYIHTIVRTNGRWLIAGDGAMSTDPRAK
jgi:uncharacterized protein (TIGR02246 family)